MLLEKRVKRNFNIAKIKDEAEFIITRKRSNYLY
jgi:hypothetical protein